MLIGLDEALRYAQKNNIAIAAVNTPYFEGLLGTIAAAEKAGVPVILQHAQVHESTLSIDDIGPAMLALATRSEAPFVLHVDHGEDIDYIARGLDIGFNSVMIDGSTLPYEENVTRTTEVVKLAKARGVGVEGELGVMTGNENGDPSQGIADETLYTEPAQAKEFVERTGVTALAASFGTVHGMYHQEPKLNYALIEQLRDATGVPIVMHGGSGLSLDEYHQSITRGVRKINYYTYAAKAALDAALRAAEQPNTILFPKVAKAVSAQVEGDVAEFIQALRPGA
ncbi:class II fructose-bisphosphate aldolase [Pseudoclavibacter terrae]|uniref:Class II fructose-bisphosphate aldolase n=1 Tax=Pseudoclavibacter terrae TaxID=1530195 RepID=A0A7J5B457_9MICO|nr:class II fructose-bisphosphate aldolase [Pseudoclavibacter terrae]KAB1638962.1 class II fructose-bisphosphate aldolase [Pseudoclavibacter terrae]